MFIRYYQNDNNQKKKKKTNFIINQIDINYEKPNK